MINGIVNIYKEKGYTSHDVVAVLRKVVGQKKIGHTGTLDPDATGVLPVCLGRATKVCELLTDHDKTYEALLLLGKTTDTQDISGEVLEERDPGDLTEEEVRSCIESFIGEYDQIPPMYSALKVNGKKLYELAREGKTVERKSRKVQIHGIRILEMNLPHVRMEVDCSKGTYIRTLCHDIGEKLQVGGCMEELERTKVGRFLKEDAVTLDEVRQKMEQGEGAELFTPLDQIFAELPAVTVTDAKAWMSYNGNDLPERFLLEKEEWTDGQEVRVYDSRKNFIGLYQYRAPKKLFHIKKMFLDPEAEKIEKKRTNKTDMQYIKGLDAFDGRNHTAVTLGKFDGLHRGHQKLLNRIMKYAQKEDCDSVVCAFDMDRDCLMTNEERRAFLEDKVDYLIEIPFTREMMEMEAEKFIDEILHKKLHASHIVVGTDFNFGHEKRGNHQMLEKYAAKYGYTVDVVEKAYYKDREISSTYIRELLLDGNVPLANELLGYPYEITSVVEHGQQLGRTLGFPTMNLAPQEKKILPKYGVYACRVLVDGVWYGGVGNAGVKPTVAQEKRRLFEVYVYGYEGDAYGKTATVQILEFERPETKFHSVEELKDRVMKDMRYGEEYLKNHPFDER